MLYIPGNEDLVYEDFATSLFGYCPILDEDNCVIKYLGKNGALRLTTPRNYLID